MQISLAESESEIKACHAVMRQLREHVSAEELTRHVQAGRAEEGYRLLFAQVEGEIVAVAGFRVGRTLAWGKFLYVDDFVVRESDRGKGFGGSFFDWLARFAKQQGCEQMHLDSGVQRSRAHRFYLNHRMEISSHHFRLKL